jgi:hypothetical protein
MAVFHPIAFTAFLFENHDFIAFLATQYRGLYHSALQVGLAHVDLTVPVRQMNFREGDLISFSCLQLVDEELLPFLNFELLTSNSDNGEHMRLVFSGCKGKTYR